MSKDEAAVLPGLVYSKIGLSVISVNSVALQSHGVPGSREVGWPAVKPGLLELGE